MMRIRHGAVTLALLAVVALLLAPGMIRAATVDGVVLTCHEFVSGGGKCHDECFSQHRGDGQCTTWPNTGCVCTYVCSPPPGHTPAAGGGRGGGLAPGSRAGQQQASAVLE